jgi:hypothetical protein
MAPERESSYQAPAIEERDRIPQELITDGIVPSQDPAG